MRPGVQGSGVTGWRAASLAGVAYTAWVFAFAFVVGAIRVTALAPRVGALAAVVLEAPIVLWMSWNASLWCVRHFDVSGDPRGRLLMGTVAFFVLMLLELGVATLAFREPVAQYLANFATAPGVIGLATQVCFATLPWVQSRSRARGAPD